MELEIKLFAKLETIRFFSNEKVFVCGKRVDSYIRSKIGTIVSEETNYIPMLFGKFWLCSFMLADTEVLPITQFNKCLIKETKNIKKDIDIIKKSSIWKKKK